MRYLKTAIIVTNILWVISIISLALYLVTISYQIITNEDINFANLIITTNQQDGLEQGFNMSKITSAISLLITLGAIFYFRRVLKGFKNMELFENSVIQNLKKSAYYLCSAAVFSLLSNFLIGLFTKNEYAEQLISNSTELAAYDTEVFQLSILSPSLFFQLGIGLFFLVLAEVLVKAKEIKEENELTI